jgi:outer membrane protein
MTALTLAALLIVAAAPACDAADVKTITLPEAYAAALKRSEEIAQKGQTYAQVVAQIDQLWSAVKPRVSLNANHVWQDTPGPGVNFPLPANQETVAVVGHQPLFSGLRDFLAVQGAKAQSAAAALALRRAKQNLYADVAAAYLDLLRGRMDIAVREDQALLTANRVKELKNFENLGRSRKSEVLAAESQEAQVEADLETSRGQQRLNQATLQFLTGIDAELVAQDVIVPTQAEDVGAFLVRGAHRPDVEAAERELVASDLYVSMQNRQYWPTVSVDGNYYLRRPHNFSRHVNWDATLSGVLPIYYGGQIGAQVREAKAQREIKAQSLSLARRSAELQVRSAHSDLVSDLAIVKALEKAMTLAEANAKAQAQDYRQGLVTNLDVLNSLTTVENTRLRLDQARMQTYDARVRLEVAAGGPEDVR